MWKQRKSLALEIFCCDTRRNLKMIHPVIAPGRCSGIVATHGRFSSLACRTVLFHWFACFVFLLMFDILYKINSTCLLVAGFPRWQRVQYSKSLTHHKYQHRHLNHIIAPKNDITKMHSWPHYQCSRCSPGMSS